MSEHMMMVSQATFYILIGLILCSVIGWAAFALIMTGIENWSAKARRRRNFVADSHAKRYSVTPDFRSSKDYK